MKETSTLRKAKSRFSASLRGTNLQFLIKRLLFLLMIFAMPGIHAQTITTDKVDYLPGDIVTVSGTGWQSFESVGLLLTELELHYPGWQDVTKNATCDVSGNFSFQIYNVVNADLGAFFHITATGMSSKHICTTVFNDAGGDYGVDYSAYNPNFYERRSFSSFPSGTFPLEGNRISPLALGGTAGSTMHSRTVESLNPQFLGLGQIVAFEFYISADASGACSNDIISVGGAWSTVTQNSGNFGFNPDYKVIAAFIDPSVEPLFSDGGTPASARILTNTLVGTNINATFEISGLDPGDKVPLEVWLVLKSSIASNVGSNVPTNAENGLTLGTCEANEEVKMGNQTVPLLQAGDFYTADVDVSVIKTDLTDPVLLCGQIQYTITVYNNGPSVANTITVTDILDGNTTYLGPPIIVDNVGTPVWGFNQSGQTLTFTTEFLDIQESVTITFPVTVLNTAPHTGTGGTGGTGSCTTGDIRNPVSITTISDDIASANNSYCQPTGVNCETVAPVLPSLPTGGDLGCNPATLPACAPGLIATDACFGQISVSCSPGAITNVGTCGKRQIFTYSATDGCSNTASALVTYTWTVDADDPVFTGCPVEVVTWPGITPPDCTDALALVTVTDGCSANIIPTCEAGVIDIIGCERKQTFTLTAENGCGKTASCVVTFTWIVDDEEPVFNGCPTEPIALGCNPTAPVCSDALALVTVTDGCSGALTPTCTAGTITENGCLISQIFTLTATDAELNRATCLVTYTWTDDTQAPVFAACPTTSIDLGCNPATLPTEAIAIAAAGSVSDNCDASLTMSAVGGTITGTCNKSQTWVVTAATDCGPDATCSIAYNWIVDITPPTIVGVGPDATIECPATPVFSTPRVSDNCDLTPSISYEDEYENCNNNKGNVPASGNALIRDIILSNTNLFANQLNKFTLEFESNQGKGRAEFTLISPYGEAIILVGPYCNGEFCDDANPSDNEEYQSSFYSCSSSHPKWNNSENIPYGSGNFEPFGGDATTTYNEGFIAANIARFNGTYVSCFDELQGSMDGTWTIYARKNDTQNGDVDFISACLTPLCPQDYSITRTWTATDKCGKTATAVQTIKVIDNTPPAFTGCPQESIAWTSEDKPTCTDALALVTVSDACSGPLTPTCKASEPVVKECQVSQIFTLTAMDDCGNTATCSVIYTWSVDDDKPEFIGCPAAPIELGCNPSQPDCDDALALVTVTDGCSGTITPSCNSGSILVNGCLRSQIFTLTATDAQLNSATCLVTYTWTVDTELPVISTTATSQNLGCNPTVAAPVFTGRDNCAGVFTPNVNTAGPGNTGCAYTQTWIATYTDACLNTALPVSITYTWTVDTKLPVISTTATSHDLGCNPTVAAPVFTGLDNCAGVFTPNVTTSGPSRCKCICNLYTQTWTANFTDACNNSAIPVSITYTWKIDNTPPVITTTAGALDVTLQINSTEGLAAALALAPLATDNCTATPTIHLISDNTVNLQNGAYNRTRVWNFTDICGNTSSEFTQIIKVIQDNGGVCAATGNISYQVWNDIGSSYSISSLTGNINYPNNPTSSTLITNMEAPPTQATAFGSRIAGYICAPVTGSYTFWIASDNEGELWLSTNDQPANKVRIAYHNGNTLAREWNKYATQKSVAINLVQGQKYYIETLMKQVWGGSCQVVGWLKPGQAGTVPSEVIPGYVLSPIGSNVQPVLVSSVTLPPTSSVNTGSTVLIPATVLPANAANPVLNWTTSDPTIAIVNSNGLVTGMAAGNVTITATSTDGSNKSGSCLVTVNAVPAVCSAIGNISYEVWNNIGSSYSISSLTGNINYPNNPTSSTLITNMEAPPTQATAFGSRIAGYICAPTTGSYTFWIASDNEGELWLSTNDQPANKVRIAYHNGNTLSREWNKYATQKSIVINLVQGQKYYIESLMKQVWGGSCQVVGWLKPGQAGTVPSEVIPGSVLSPIGSNVQPVLVSSVTLPPTSSVNTGSTVLIPATVLPANATNPVLNWTTSDPAIAIVNSNGLVTGMAAGNVTITATSTDGSNKSGSCLVIVNTVPSVCSATGNISYQVWNNIGSSYLLSSLTGNANYPDNPTSSTLITTMEAPPNLATQFGSRIAGYICAPVTGSYTFWIASDNEGELWLSTNDQPANKVRIAYHNGYTASREWNKYATQKSVAINLVQGQKYYIEALMKQVWGGSCQVVGWLKPGQAGTVPSEVIPGSVLSHLILNVKTAEINSETPAITKKAVPSFRINVAPNPFVDQTKISFRMKEGAKISLEIYSLMGTKIATLYEGYAEEGLDYSFFFTPDGYHGTQTFMYVLRTPDGIFTDRIILQR